MILPPLPMDDSALDLYWQALHPGPDADRSSIGETLDMLAQMAGADPAAIEERIGDDVVIMRDPTYHPNDLISALIEELRGARDALRVRYEDEPDWFTGKHGPHAHPTEAWLETDGVPTAVRQWRITHTDCVPLYRQVTEGGER